MMMPRAHDDIHIRSIAHHENGTLRKCACLGAREQRPLLHMSMGMYPATVGTVRD